MTPMSVYALLLVPVLGAAVPTVAGPVAAPPALVQDPVKPAPAPQQDPVPAPAPTAKEDAICTFDVRDQPVDRVVEYVRHATGLEIPVDGEMKDRPITLRVERLPWRAALEEVAWRGGMVIVDDDLGLRLMKGPADVMRRAHLASLPLAGRPWVPEEAGPGMVTLDVTNKPLEKTLELIAGSAGGDFWIFAQGMQRRRVSMKVTEVPWQQALLALAVKVDGVVFRRGVRTLILREPPPAYLRTLMQLVDRCAREGEAYRRADKARDFLLMAGSKRMLQQAEADLTRRIEALPEDLRTGEAGDRLHTHVLGYLESVRETFKDLLAKAPPAASATPTESDAALSLEADAGTPIRGRLCDDDLWTYVELCVQQIVPADGATPAKVRYTMRLCTADGRTEATATRWSKETGSRALLTDSIYETPQGGTTHQVFDCPYGTAWEVDVSVTLVQGHCVWFEARGTWKACTK